MYTKTKCRIELTDSTMDMMMKMSGGNPGVANVLVQILTKSAEIDPDSAMGGLGAILSLDSYGIYESDIWLFYKDICGQDLVKMLAVMRAVQLGYYSREGLISAINSPYDQNLALPIDELCAKVKERLPNFNI